MGFWNAERLLDLVPTEGAFVRTRLGPAWLSWKVDYYGQRVYAVGSVAALNGEQAAAVLNMIGAFPPRAQKAAEPASEGAN